MSKRCGPVVLLGSVLAVLAFLLRPRRVVGDSAVMRRPPVRASRVAVVALVALCLVQAGCAGTGHPSSTAVWSPSTVSGARPDHSRPSSPPASIPSGHGGAPGTTAAGSGSGGSRGVAGGPGGGGGATPPGNGPLVASTDPAPPTAGLSTLYQAITVNSRSVSAVVHAPAGLPVTNVTEISVLFGDRRISQDYDPAAGNTIAYDYPVGDGTRRSEMLTINLTEHAPGGAVPFHFYRFAAIEAQFEVVVSDLTFTLLNDCDLVGDSEPVVTMADDRGPVDVALSMSADDVRHLHQMSRFVPAATVADGLVAPQVSFFEDDLGGFHSQSGTPTGPPLLPGTSRSFHFDEEAGGHDEFCNAQFDYTIGITLLTFHSL